MTLAPRPLPPPDLCPGRDLAPIPEAALALLPDRKPVAAASDRESARAAPELADPLGALEVGEHEDVEQVAFVLPK